LRALRLVLLNFSLGFNINYGALGVCALLAASHCNVSALQVV